MKIKRYAIRFDKDEDAPSYFVGRLLPDGKPEYGNMEYVFAKNLDPVKNREWFKAHEKLFAEAMAANFVDVSNVKTVELIASITEREV
jgi:methionine synthase II (cobalamin-independent)